MKHLTHRLVLAVIAAMIGMLFTPVRADAVWWWPSGPNCGANIAKPTGGNWRCTFADEFNGSSLDTSKWVVQQTASSGFHSGSECFVSSSNNVRVSAGALSLTARRESAPFSCKSPYGAYTTQVTSGSVSTWGKFAQAYGRFEIRAKFPASTIAGLHSALWMYPQKLTYGAWPTSGEIDIAEEYSQYPDRAIPYVHYATATNDSTVTNTRCMISDVSAFHTYVAEWTTTGITISYDGVPCVTHKWNPAAPLTGSKPFDQPFIVWLTQALGNNTNAYSATTTQLPATTQVDYVHVWS